MRQSATGSAACGRIAGPACCARRAIPTPRWPASSAKRCASLARRCSRSRASPARAGKVGEGRAHLGETRHKEPPLPRAINRFARRAVAGIVATYGDGIVKLVSETVRSWDVRTVTDRLEAAVGRDLQYIRINGT